MKYLRGIRIGKRSGSTYLNTNASVNTFTPAFWDIKVKEGIFKMIVKNHTTKLAKHFLLTWKQKKNSLRYISIFVIHSNSGQKIETDVGFLKKKM